MAVELCTSLLGPGSALTCSSPSGMTGDSWESDEDVHAARRKIHDRLARLTLWKLRDMRRRWTRPRARRLPKEARALKSLLAEAQAAGLVPPAPPAKGRRRRNAGACLQVPRST